MTAHGYSARDVARLVGVRAGAVRSWARAGVLSPGVGPDGDLRFSFQDVVLLRTAEGLRRERLPPRRIRRALLTLRRSLPTDRPLSALQLASDGGRVVVRDGAALFEAESGQRVFDFVAHAPAAPATGLSILSRERRSPAAAVAAAEQAPDPAPAPAGLDGAAPLGADELYERAVALEDVAPSEAQGLYLACLAIDPAHPDAHVNLGRVLHQSGELTTAEAHYRLAMAARPNDSTTLFNLAIVLDDLGRLEEAALTYERALGADPTNADAHYNLALLCERLGRHEEVLRHLKAYRTLVRPPRRP